MNIYDKPRGRNRELVARGTCRHAKGLLFAAAVLVVLTIFIVLNIPMTRIHAGPVAVAPSITTQPTSQTVTASSAFTMWAESSLVRVGKTALAGTASFISLSGARGETVDTQVIVRAPAGGLTNVNLSASALTGPGGVSIAASSVTLYREYYVSVTGTANLRRRQQSTAWFGNLRGAAHSLQ